MAFKAPAKRVNGAIIVAKSIDEALDIVNRGVAVVDVEDLLPRGADPTNVGRELFVWIRAYRCLHPVFAFSEAGDDAGLRIFIEANGEEPVTRKHFDQRADGVIMYVLVRDEKRLRIVDVEQDVGDL